MKRRTNLKINGFSRIYLFSWFISLRHPEQTTNWANTAQTMIHRGNLTTQDPMVKIIRKGKCWLSHKKHKRRLRPFNEQFECKKAVLLLQQLWLTIIKSAINLHLNTIVGTIMCIILYFYIFQQSKIKIQINLWHSIWICKLDRHEIFNYAIDS